MNTTTTGPLTADELIALRDRWRMVSRQIEEMLIHDGYGLTGRLEINAQRGYVRNYKDEKTNIPEDVERRFQERRTVPRDGGDRRG